MGTDFAAIKNNKFNDYLAYFFICLPPAIYFLIVGKFAVNIPYHDDYPAILQFLIDYKASTITGKILLLFSQHNEHRILFMRFVIATYYSIFGNINFRNIIFIGNIQLIFILLISIYFTKKALPNYWKLCSFIISLCIFDITSWNNADWAMASVQNYGIIFLFFGSLFFYSLNKKAFLFWAVFFQFLCTFSSGNGIIASLSLVIFTIFSRDKVKIICALASFLIFSPMYFIHFTPTHYMNIITTRDFIFYLLHIISGHINVGQRNYDDYMNEFFSIIYIICIIVFIPFNKKLNIKIKNIPFVSILIFILGTMVVICKYRVVIGTVQSRYIIYCHYITGIIFLFYLMKFQQYKHTNIVCIMFTVFMLLNYGRDFKIGYSGFKWWYNGVVHDIPDQYTPLDPVKEKELADESCRLNIYCAGEKK